MFAVSVDRTDDYFLKLYSLPDGRWRVEREAVVYSVANVPRPRVVAVDVAEGYLLTEAAGPGNLAQHFKTSADCTALFQEMGSLLRRFHTTLVQGLAPTDRSDLVAARATIENIIRRDARKRFAAACPGEVDPSGWRQFERVLNCALVPSGDDRLLHGDYNTRQVVLTPDRAGVAAVLDFEYACIGDPVLDLLRMEMSGIRGRDAFYRGYGPLPLRHQSLNAVLDLLDQSIATAVSGDGGRRAIARGRLLDALLHAL